MQATNFAENAVETRSSCKGGKIMQVRIDITRQDYWKMNKYGIMHNPIMGTLFFLIMMGAPILLLVKLLGYSADRTTIHIAASIITALIFGGLVDLVFYILLKILVMIMLSGKQGVLGEHLIEISEKGVYESTSVNEGLHFWKGVQSIKQDKRYIFIFIEPTMAHAIPKRSFSSPREADEFFNAAIAYWNSDNIL
jgi:hypothetical protein